jgi:hypothetical protein
MAITITLNPSNVDGSASNFVYAIATLTFSGNYVVGGDTLDFTQIAGSALNNWKLKAFAGGGSELTASPYPADVVQLTLTARKLI